MPNVTFLFLAEVNLRSMKTPSTLDKSQVSEIVVIKIIKKANMYFMPV